jgi:hypothetical protein
LKTLNRRQKYSFSQVIANLAPNFGLGLTKLTFFSKIRTPKALRVQELNREPLNFEPEYKNIAELLP